MSDVIVSATDLTKAFGPDAGVFDMDLELPEGKIIGMIGPSGSGKTTTVRLMTGILQPDRGHISVLGSSPSAFDKETKGRIGYMPQHAILYPDLTLAQNLSFAASLYGVPSSQRDLRGLAEFLGIEGVLDRYPDQASGGERRRVMLAATLIHRPDLLFLDEPTAGIDPVLRRRIWDRLKDLAGEGRSLIVTTQYVGEAAYCDLVAVLAGGRILTVETPEGLRRAAYGGELVDVVFESPPRLEDIEALESAVDGKMLTRLDARSLRLVVSDAGESAPRIADWASQAPVTIQETEAHIPNFDDVFVELVEMLEERQGREGAHERNPEGTAHHVD